MTNAIVVPTYPKDFHWTYKLLDTASKDENIILVFGSEDERKAFSHPFTNVAKIVAPQQNVWSIPTYKKTFGIMRAQQWGLDYVATIDTEAVFLQPTTPKLEEIWKKNPFVANYYSDSYNRNYIYECLQCKRLDPISDYPYPTNLYYWFNDIQVYPCKLVMPFLEWLPTELPHYCYDYLMFGLYMITQHDHELRILDAKVDYGVVEDMPKHQQHAHFLSDVHWSPYFKGVEKYDNLLMYFHLDRYAHTPA